MRMVPESVLNYMSALYMSGVADTLKYLQHENADTLVEEIKQYYER